MAATKRNPGLDIVRCIALFYMMSAHFLLNTGFYDAPVVGWQMYLMTFIRSICIPCVTIFLMLSGFFLKNAQLNPKYYTRLLKVYITYVLASFICTAADVYFNGMNHSLFSAVYIALSFPEKFYSWYINMYLGLFLLIPFLNILYNNLTQNQKKVLIASLLVMTALPSIFNTTNITNPSWWLNPASSQVYHRLIPDWWTGIYPITYYFMGAYIRDYPLKWKRSTHLALLLLAVLINGGYNIYRSYGVPFISGDWTEQRTILCTLPGFLTFTLFQNMDLSRMSNRMCKLFSKMSSLSLGAFMLSWVPEQYIYPIIEELQPVIPLQVYYFPIAVPFVFVCAIVLAAVVDWLSTLICKGLYTAGDWICRKPMSKQ